MIFRLNTDGTGYSNLHSFPSIPMFGPPTNNEGTEPHAELMLSGNTLYGTASEGGTGGRGTVFALNTDGTGFRTLHSFTATAGSAGLDGYGTNSDGAIPLGGLVVSGHTLYGTTSAGGSVGYGTVFAVNTDGTGFTNLHTFAWTSDGAVPYAGLVLSGKTLYGTASAGGRTADSSGLGVVFAVNTDGTGYTNLHSFNASDGGEPFGGLVLSGSTLYGTTRYGTVFAVHTNGTGFTNLYRFTATSGSPPINRDGDAPDARLALSGNTLYGTAHGGGSAGDGTVFAINTDGTGFTNLHSFTATSGSYTYDTNSDGAYPYAGLICAGNTLYGTATHGGPSGYGTLFSVSLGSGSAPQLTINRSGANVIVTWLTNSAGFTLRSTTNLLTPAVWSTVSPGPVVVNGQNTVTNPISGTQRFYRLSQGQ